MRTRPLIDEETKQAAQCRELGDGLYPTNDRDADDEPAFGSDPFDILMFRQEQGDLQ